MLSNCCQNSLRNVPQVKYCRKTGRKSIYVNQFCMDTEADGDIPKLDMCSGMKYFPETEMPYWQL